MGRFLKQSTAAQVRTIGPFIDSTDFVTASTGLTVANTDVRLKKNGADDVAKNSGGATHDVNGCYHLTFDATDTDTVGELFYSVKVAGALQVFGVFTVLEEAIYDAYFAASATGLLPANVTQWLGSAAATPTVAGVPEVDVTHWIGTAAATPTVAGVPEVDVTHLVGVAQSATDLKDFADDGYDPSTNKVQGVVLTDTVTTYTGNTPQTGDSFARLGAPAGASVSADIATKATQASVDDLPTNAELATALGTADDAVLAQVALVKAKTDSLTFTVAGKVDANATHVNDTEVGGAGTAGNPWGPV